MKQFTKTLRDIISETKPRDFVYLGIIVLFLIIVGILFYLAAQFIAKNINSAFSTDVGGEESSLNMANYTLVAKKLGITIQEGASNALSPAATSTLQEPVANTVNEQVFDKKSLSINILNSTAKKGAATILSQAIEASGFTKAVTGNGTKVYPITTIIIREGRTSFAPALLESVKKIYPSAIATTTTNSASFDVTIIIGSK